MIATSEAQKALYHVIRETTRIETLLTQTVDAWQQLDHQQRVNLGQKHPHLVDALINLENQTKRTK